MYVLFGSPSKRITDLFFLWNSSMHDISEAHDPRRVLQYHLRRSNAVSAHPSPDSGKSAAHEVRTNSSPK